MKAREIMREREPDVKVRESAFLELKHPQVMNLREPVAEPGQPGIEMFFDGSAIGNGFVVRKTELRYERNTGVSSQEPEPAAGVIREALNLRSNGWRRDHTLCVPCAYNLGCRRIDKKGTGRIESLRYAAINKRRGNPLPPGRAGRGGLFSRALRPT